MNITLLDSGNYFVGEHHRLCVKPTNTRFDTKVFMVHDADLCRDQNDPSPCVNQFESLHDAFLYCRRVLKGLKTERHEAWL